MRNNPIGNGIMKNLLRYPPNWSNNLLQFFEEFICSKKTKFEKNPKKIAPENKLFYSLQKPLNWDFYNFVPYCKFRN